MKKAYSFIMFALVLALVGSTALAATTPTKPAPVKYTAEQQTCINNARKAQQAAIKPAQEAFNAATANALKTKQAAIRSAQEAFDTATADALATRQAAIADAQQITDPQKKIAAMKAATDEYNNNSAVKTAKVPYEAAIKAANDAYNNDPSVQKNKPAYTEALKAARTDVTKECIGVAGGESFWDSIGNFFEEATSSLLNAFKRSTSALINAFTFVR